MNRTSAVARIKRGLGFRSDLDDEIISALQEAKRFLEQGRTLPFFLKVEDELLSVPIGTGEIALPTGFIRPVDGEGLSRVYDDGTDRYWFLEKMRDLETLQLLGDTNTSGGPVAYVLRRETIAFWPPTRDANYELYWSYYKQSQSLATDISTNEWLDEEKGNPEALIGRAGMIIAADIRDANATAIFKAMYDEAWGNAFAETILREEAEYPDYIGERN